VDRCKYVISASTVVADGARRAIIPKDCKLISFDAKALCPSLPLWPSVQYPMKVSVFAALEAKIFGYYVPETIILRSCSLNSADKFSLSNTCSLMGTHLRSRWA